MLTLFFLSSAVELTGKLTGAKTGVAGEYDGRSMVVSGDEDVECEGEIQAEEVAAITAAIIAYRGNRDFAIRDITQIYRRPFNRWALSGISEQMDGRGGIILWKGTGSRSMERSLK